MRSLTDISFLEMLPPSISDDPAMMAAAMGLNEQLQKSNARISHICPHAMLDEIREPLLTEIAWEEQVEVWDGAWSEERKREVIRESFRIKKRKGTRGAVVRSLESMGFGVEYLRWFEYGGEPACFRVSIAVRDRGVDEATLAQVHAAIAANKALRSHLDTLAVRLSSSCASRVGVATVCGSLGTVYPWQPGIVEQHAATYCGATCRSITTSTIYPQE